MLPPHSEVLRMRQAQSTAAQRIFRGDTLVEKREGAPVVGAVAAHARPDDLYRGKDLNGSNLYRGKEWEPSDASTCRPTVDGALAARFRITMPGRYVHGQAAELRRSRPIDAIERRCSDL